MNIKEIKKKKRLNFFKSFPRATWVFIIAFWAALFFDIFFRQIDHLIGQRYGYNLTVITIVNLFCTVLYSLLFILKGYKLSSWSSKNEL